MLTNAAILLLGHAGTAACLLARNLAVAALIPAEDYGVAVSFAMAMALVEMGTQIGVPSQIVRCSRGEDPRWIAAVHGFEICRGILAALALFLAAGPIAAFLGAADAAWAFRALAIAPLLRGFQHVDIHRQTRESRHGPVILVGLWPAGLALAAVFPLAMWLGDWRIMVISLVLQEVVALATSHLLSRRPYRIGFDTAAWSGLMRFGWPILLQGIVLFAAFHGDKILVARSLGLETLGVFAMGMTLTLTPALILARSVQSGFLPLLTRAPDRAVAAATVEAGIVGAAGLAAVAAFALGPVVLPILGAGFAPLAELLALLGVQQALRVFRSGATTVALGAGRAKVSLCADAVRAIGLAPIAIILWQGGGLYEIVLVGTAFEAFACLVAFVGIRDRVPPSACLPAGLAGAATCVGIWTGAGPVVVSVCVVATVCLARNLRRIARAPGTARSVPT
ncbi:Membrane protein involved in the export of O-antigen and teichoic acid [Palleronia marisminoris]|uniref:Colanic acid exporter n=1 Tax=Palleronia marisminoris TaxID=315423 RepID=A0A1Y5SH73_9RHOB|nr:oligosaccharide flippase family protein [Palleronia marisminoris]SFG82814.1 Membrane protein involved in the export of O-antigen and teichoic acid [Palleronia marisminoris]SLN40753.1 colanic acid exporter [Palleronia marisminoris]